MTTFREFLKNSGVGGEIDVVTSETVSFKNKNDKKFAYPIGDLQQCLQALWKSSDTVQEILNGDWKYEESKFRQAFAAAFKNEGANTVASNLGSQTPNTVRCLELYAFFKLGKAPTSKLEKPDILSGENLNELFYDGDLRVEFQNWLRDQQELSSKSTESYTGAVSGILSKCAGKELLRISSQEIIESLRERIVAHPDFIKHDGAGNNMYGAALNHYSTFLGERSGLKIQKNSEITLSKISTEFAKAIANAGFTVPT